MGGLNLSMDGRSDIIATGPDRKCEGFPDGLWQGPSQMIGPSPTMPVIFTPRSAQVFSQVPQAGMEPSSSEITLSTAPKHCLGQTRANDSVATMRPSADFQGNAPAVRRPSQISQQQQLLLPEPVALSSAFEDHAKFT